MGQHVSGKRKYRRKKCRIVSDERIELAGAQTKKHYKHPLRLIAAKVKVKGKLTEMKFLTNNLDWSPFSVCQLYQCRWGIEVFFKEIKQTLQLADFLGCNENAVRWQIWTALLAYLLLRFIAWHNRWKHHFSRLFTLLRAVLWNFFRLSSVIECCDTPRIRTIRIRGSPDSAYQPCRLPAMLRRLRINSSVFPSTHKKGVLKNQDTLCLFAPLKHLFEKIWDNCAFI